MALSYVDVNGTLYIPGSYASWDVAPSSSGTSATGVVVLVGEADSGPSFSEEDVVATGGFGVNSKASVVSKFGSGRLVDAYLNAIAPSKDADVKGSPTRIFLVKTNTGTKATATLASTYAVLTAKSAGALGNLINYKAATAAGSKMTVTVSRKSDNVSNTYTFGNNVCLNVGAHLATTLNMVIGPTTLTSAGNVASATVTFTSAAADKAVTINGHAFTARSSAPGTDEWLQTGTDAQDAAAFAAAVTASVSPLIAGVVTAVQVGSTNVVTISAVATGTAGNAITLISNDGSMVCTGSGYLAGGVVESLNVTLANFTTLGDLASFISTKIGWVATAVGAFTQLSPSALDQGTTDVHSAAGTADTGIKKDAYEFVQALNSSQLVSVTTAPTTGLPTAQNIFLSGGALGITTDTNVTNALVQAARITANFVVCLFSQDATADIALGQTSSSPASTYTISGVNAALASHVSACSQFKSRKPRQGFASLSSTFVAQKLAAQTMASYRVSMAFLNVMAAGADGTLKFFQPWMGSVVAAAMQASAGYRPMFNKSVNLYGVQSPQSDFIVEDTGNIEDALQAGLLVIAPRPADGAICFVSDQTTYGVDSNFVLNSIQAVYAADVIAQTAQQRMEIAYVGKSFADVSAGVAMSYFKSIMAELRRLKYIVGSDDAPSGFKNATIQIQAPYMLVSAEVKPATGIYFIPIHFMLTQATQSASA